MPKKSIKKTGSSTLSRLRAEIDSIDRNILRHINKRASVARKIAEEKKRILRSVYDPEREKQVETKIARLNKGPLSGESAVSIFREIIRSCRVLQAEGKVSYLGPEGSFSHQAAANIFCARASLFPHKTIEEVFDSVLTGSVSKGVVPIENSTEGPVGNVLEMIYEGEFQITGERFEKINHFLLSKTASEKNIKKVVSHPQALGQCRNWLSANLPGVKTVEVSSTAAAAAEAAKNAGVAAISSAYAADIYKLTIARKNIEDNPLNSTRFVTVERQNGSSVSTGEGNKVSVAFTINDKPGALHKTLFSPLASAGVNLTRIESRPSGKKAWEYMFFVDFEGAPGQKETDRLIEKIEARSSSFKVLGCYFSGGKKISP
ncbi:MAG: prephenate dehydratase [Thermodesulfobacteriota bacterium]